jgi:NADH-quinone oxidoreductase subunit C
MSAMSAEQDAARLRERFGDGILSVGHFRGEVTVVAALAVLFDLLRHCKEELGYVLLLDISSLDHFGDDPRFEVVYEVATLDDSRHLRVKVAVAEDGEVPSAAGVWPAADWHEREVWDMMGIRFSGHPDLRRILMWEGYPFHPLRKDFPLAGRPSEMPDVAFTGVAPLEGGPFVTCAGGEDTIRREPRARVLE